MSKIGRLASRPSRQRRIRHLACSAEVACSHVSGLFTQSGGTAGPDGVREPSPHHSNGIDVPMKRQVWLGCVGSTDCAITRHCSLASSRTWLSGLSRRGHALVVLMPVHHRPGDARGLVGERDGYDQRRSPPTEPDHPRIGFGRLRSQQISAGTVDQKPAQILVAALGYPAQAMFAAGGILPWHQTQPGRELAPTAEAARFYHRGGDGCGDDRADARNARQALADGVALVPPKIHSEGVSKIFGRLCDSGLNNCASNDYPFWSIASAGGNRNQPSVAH